MTRRIVAGTSLAALTAVAAVALMSNGTQTSVSAVSETPVQAPAAHRALAVQIEPVADAPTLIVAHPFNPGSGLAPLTAPEQHAAAPIIEQPAATPPADVLPTSLAPTEAAAEPAKPAPPPITLIAKVDLTKQRLTVVENGQTKFTWMISSGAKGFETPRGNFQPQWMAKEWFSRKYDNAPMPHSVFFKDGAAIHATMNPGSLGTAASHGCVRLSQVNAATFFAMVRRHSMAQTRIQVFGAPRHAPEAVASRHQTNRTPIASVVPTQRPVYSGNGSAFEPRAYPAHFAQARVVQYSQRSVRY